MKKTLLALLVFSAPILLAQETPPAPAQEKEETKTVQPKADATSAPKLGHPLDPADVDILTGKAKQSAPYRLDPVPYGFAGNGGYPVNVARYNSSQFAHVTTATSAPFTPLLFGRVAGRSFFVIGNTTSFAPPLFFFGRGLLTPGNFFFVPSRPRFSRFGR